MPIWLFLKAISPREWLFAAVAALAVYGAIYFYRAGEAHVKTADARAVAVQQEKVHVSEQLIGDRISAALAAYIANTAAPPPPPAPAPRIVCHSASGGGSVHGGQSAASGGDAGNSGSPTSATEVDGGFDPAPAVSAIGEDADAEIAALRAQNELLKGIVRAYQAGGVVAK
jgi:hypothetical protein